MVLEGESGQQGSPLEAGLWGKADRMTELDCLHTRPWACRDEASLACEAGARVWVGGGELMFRATRAASAFCICLLTEWGPSPADQAARAVQPCPPQP